MQTVEIPHPEKTIAVKPLCPVFGECGGCAYQDLPYEEELRLKENQLKEIFQKELSLSEECFEPIMPSPRPYHYRSRLDLGLRRTGGGDYFMGFMPAEGRRIIPVESCAIAAEEISDFLPELRREAIQKLPADYRTANLVIKTGDDGRIFWGGIGRRSLAMQPADYLWTIVNGKKIFYSLDTFFQANLSILGKVLRQIAKLGLFTREVHFLDLYGGVGLFGISVADKVQKVTIVEENIPSAKLAEHNAAFHGLGGKVGVRSGRIEDELPALFQSNPALPQVAFVDPPRQGLNPKALEILAAGRHLKALLYLSCNPQALVRDLKGFIQNQWTVKKVMPLDFFPKTKHIETLVLLKPKRELFFAGRLHPLEIEIGCGKSKFLIARAEKYPAIHFIGIDRLAKWMKIGEKRAQNKNLGNIQFLQAEAREFLEQSLPSESVSRFHIYFPDPWPKRRHRKRRLVNEEFLESLYSRLIAGGIIHFMTDDPDYFGEVRNVAQRRKVRWGRITEKINERFEKKLALTNYEAKYQKQGRDRYYLELEK
jgi:tRNA (guanine-N(7)-)-methyltransferase